MEKKMETTMVYWGYIGIVEKKMEATIVYWDAKRLGLSGGGRVVGCRIEGLGLTI